MSFSGYHHGDIVFITIRARVHEVTHYDPPDGHVLKYTYTRPSGATERNAVVYDAPDITITTTTPSREPWQRSLPNPLAHMFAPATLVRHLNPMFADWAGLVSPDPETGQFIKTNDMAVFGEPLSTTVRIHWNHLAAASWVGVECVAPATGGGVPA